MLKRVPETLILCIAILLFVTVGPVRTAAITVDATPIGKTNLGILGHNVRYFNGAVRMWDSSNDAVKKSAAEALRAAGIGEGATVRFPGGNYVDRYHWRRGVGSVRDRPQDDNPYEPGHDNDYNNDFGTDELIQFIAQVYPGAKPMLGVNWYDWNFAGDRTSEGALEAANWVEYCNGSGPGLQEGIDRGWKPSRFVRPHDLYIRDPESYRKWDAVEWSDSWKDSEPQPRPARTCWRSDESAPVGYFAWLRDYFAWERGGRKRHPSTRAAISRDPGPYEVRYWEVGNEVWKYYAETNDWRMTERQAEAYGQDVKTYSRAMKGRDASIRIGAVMDDRNNMRRWSRTADTWHYVRSTYPNVGPWDTAVLKTCAEAIDFVSCHMGISPTDERYSLYIYGNRLPAPQTEPVYLRAGKYEFRVRAQGTPSGDGSDSSDYPQMAGWLIPCTAGGKYSDLLTQPCGDSWLRSGRSTDSAILRMTAVASGKRSRTVGADNVHRTRFPDDAPARGQKMTSPDDDYRFSIDAPSDGYYIPWVSMINNNNNMVQCGAGDNGMRMSVALMSYSAPDLGIVDRLVEWRSSESQMKALYAAPRILARRLAALRSYIDATGSKIRIAVTECGYHDITTADQDQVFALKAGIIVADQLQEMMKTGDAELANLWSEEKIAQPFDHEFDILRDCRHGKNGTCGWDHDPQHFVISAQARAFGLLTRHTCDSMLDVRTTGIPTFAHKAYGGIPAPEGPDDATPYVSVMATRDRESKRICVLVINKYAPGSESGDIECSVTITHAGKAPSKLTAYTYGGNDKNPTAADLDKPNSIEHPDRIGVTSNEVTGTLYSDGKITLPRITFAASTITVLEVELSDR